MCTQSVSYEEDILLTRITKSEDREKELLGKLLLLEDQLTKAEECSLIDKERISELEKRVENSEKILVGVKQRLQQYTNTKTSM